MHKKHKIVRTITSFLVGGVGIFFAIQGGLPMWVIAQQVYIIVDGLNYHIIPMLILGISAKFFVIFSIFSNLWNKIIYTFGAKKKKSLKKKSKKRK